MKYKFILLIALIILLALSGCLKINMREEINAEGMSNLSIEMDMSALMAFPEMKEMETNPCDDLETDPTQEVVLTDIECTFEDGVMTMSGKLDRTKTPGFSMEDGKYRLDIKESFESMSSARSTEEGMNMPESEEEIAQAKAFGFEMNYFVKMPGNVTNQEGGELQDDGFVKFDFLDMPDTAFVESEIPKGIQLDLITTFAIGGVIAILAVAGLLFFVMKR